MRLMAISGVLSARRNTWVRTPFIRFPSANRRSLWSELTTRGMRPCLLLYRLDPQYGSILFVGHHV